MNCDESQFQITVKENLYNVSVSYDNKMTSHFKIETEYDYLFTLSMDPEGEWFAENDVKVINETVIDQIGRAIEEHDLK